MKEITRTINHAAVARFFVLAALLVLWVPPSQAALSNGQFSVSINLLMGNPQTGEAQQTGFCKESTGTGNFAAAVTYVCSTGTVVDVSPTGAYRYVTVFRGGKLWGTVDSYTGIGTITSWRVVSLTDLDYLEMMVLW